MKSINKTLAQLILALFIIFASFTNGKSAEIDDSTLFIEAFNAYQQKDYLLVIDKCDQLNEVFPDSPLRDVTLLLTARASLRSGDNDRAARSAALFSSEYPDSSLKPSVENELKLLAERHNKGEVFSTDKTLQASARKVRSDGLVREREAKLKLERERLAKVKAEQERLALIKLEAEQRENERLLAEKLAKENILVGIILHDGAGPIPVGGNASLAVEVSNKGKSSEEFLLSITAAKEYNAILTKANKPGENLTRLKLAPGETFKGTIVLKMPDEMVDGHRSVIAVKAVSAKFSDIFFQEETIVVSSAPLVRAVAKLAKQTVTPGEKLRYRVTVLNVGSLPAQDLTVRLRLPTQVDFNGSSDIPFKQEPDGTLLFKINKIGMGQLAEINLDVKISETSAIGEQLRGQVEVATGNQKRNSVFTSSNSVVQMK